MAKKLPADSRYDRGSAQTPWAAAGERYRPDDVAELVRFLLPPRPGAGEKYRAAMARVRAAIDKMEAVSMPATKLSLGSRVREAEQKTCAYFGARHACFTSQWTAGMEIAYKLSGLKPGDEVIVPAIASIASIVYPLAVGAGVVFADVDPRTVTLDPADVERKITPRTRVIMPVHIGGIPVDMDPLMRVAERNGIWVIEDAAHGMGARYKGRYLGTIGHFGGFSLHEARSITSFGEGGLLLTNTDLGDQLGRARFLGLDFTRSIPGRLYDVTPLYDRFGQLQVPGNSSATEIQALGYLLQLKRLKSIIARRRKVAETLARRLAREPAILPPFEDSADTASSHHLFLLRIDPKKAGGDIRLLRAKLKTRGVTEIPHFGPLYRFRMLAELGYDADAIARSCPTTEEVYDRGFTHLPLSGLTDEQVEYMAQAVLDAIAEMRAGT
jgi:perosamine synthetase